MGHVLWLSIPSCQWSYDHIWSPNMWWIQHSLTTKRLMVEWNVTHIMRMRALNLQFCWDLVHSKQTTNSHYRLLWTTSWSHKQMKLISWQLIEIIRAIGYVCGQEVVASQREKRAVFGAELPHNKYLTHASLIQMQLPDSRTGKEHITYFAPVLLEVDRVPRRHICWLISYRNPLYNCLDADLCVSTKPCTAIAGGFDDEEQAGASIPTLDLGSLEAKQIRSWFFIA